MTRISRRNVLELLGAGPVAAAMAWTSAEAAQAHEHATQARATATTTAPFKPKFFTAHEYATVRVLVDLIIPRDERSGSATDAGVPEFMDFMMIDQPRRQVAMRGGLALVDRLSQTSFGKPFIQSTDAQRRELLDVIAFTRDDRGAMQSPTRSATLSADPAAKLSREPGLSQAIAFFTSFRDLTATGFFTSKMGMADLQYQGNVFVAEWKGCSNDAMKKLGVIA
jgi:gluconate 2-dehydrogenase gamma chain